jgi:hypothetical protein
MYHTSAVSLLETLREIRHVDLGISWARSEDGQRVWVLDARSADGEFWRVQHEKLSGAASVLSEMLIAASINADGSR